MSAGTPRGKGLGSIFNSDINNILHASSGARTTPAEYTRAVEAILDLRPGLLAQNVGMPDPVIYPSAVATCWDRYHEEVSLEVWPDSDPAVNARQADAMRALRAPGTDPLTLTAQACRRRGVPLVASYRMNAEDFYHATYRLSDFGRAHADLRVPGAGCLDPLHPVVFDQRLEIFREVVERFDVDGLELDFRRWYHMVSNPTENHPVLTRMVRACRQLLDEVARGRGCPPLLLGARVGPSLDSDPTPCLFPGIFYPEKPTNASCRELGLDVATWIGEGLLHYVCPSLFLDGLPGLPLTREFAELARGTATGVYPTLWGFSAWMHGIGERVITLEESDRGAQALFKDDLCTAALRMYEDGADGVSTYNWYAHLRNAGMPNVWSEGIPGPGGDAVLTAVHPLLADPQALRRYRATPRV
ncbi:MAG: hypothetical protein AB1505_03575 [Candidatus Latescibacterota bacterium]